MSYKKFILFLCAILICLVFRKTEIYKATKTIVGQRLHFISLMSPQYKKDKSLIQPFFDEAFYKFSYLKKIKESGLSPIDHFMLHGWNGSVEDDCDPAPWFNITAYKRCFGGAENPFVSFIKRKSTSDKEKKSIVVYANAKQFSRAFLACEGLIERFSLELILPEKFKGHIPIFFRIQEQKGMKISFVKNEITFYQSDFLRNPEKYGLTQLKLEDKMVWDRDITRVKYPNIPEFHWHQMYHYVNWFEKSLVNPTVLNIGNLTDEPVLSFSTKTFDEFKKFMNRVAECFDMLLGPGGDIQKMKVVPGYMETWVDELPQEKEPTVSFLLSKHKSESQMTLYSLRREVFDFSTSLPKKYYVSKRQIKTFSEDLKPYEMPTDSKKWIFKSMFNVAIENTQQENYFTEKLLGCFETLTIPIYMGCPNIGDYFDTRGMIIVNSAEEIRCELLNISVEKYQKMLPYAKKNKELMKKMLNLKMNYIKTFIIENMGREH